MAASYDELIKEGQSELNKGRSSVALDAFKKAMKLSPNLSDPYYMSAFALLQWSTEFMSQKMREQGVSLSTIFQNGMTPKDAMKASSVDLARQTCKGRNQETALVAYEGARISGMTILTEGEAWIKKALEISPNDPKLHKLNDEYQQIFAKETVKGKGGCYIATACYGSYNHPDVLVFRRFRDQSLLTTSIGKFLVTVYYAVSPPLAAHLGHMHWLSGAIRKWFLEPLARKLR